MFKYSSALLGIVVSFLAFAQHPNRQFISIEEGKTSDVVVVNVSDGHYQISFFDNRIQIVETSFIPSGSAAVQEASHAVVPSQSKFNRSVKIRENETKEGKYYDVS